MDLTIPLLTSLVAMPQGAPRGRWCRGRTTANHGGDAGDHLPLGGSGKIGSHSAGSSIFPAGSDGPWIDSLHTTTSQQPPNLLSCVGRWAVGLFASAVIGVGAAMPCGNKDQWIGGPSQPLKGGRERTSMVSGCRQEIGFEATSLARNSRPRRILYRPWPLLAGGSYLLAAGPWHN